MDLKVKINMRGLQAGILAASKYSKRTVPQLINTAAYWIAINAKNSMPFVNPEKIDFELGVTVNPKIGKNGQILSQRYAKNRTYAGQKRINVRSASGKIAEVPLAAMVIVARSNPGSNYNRLTNSRYLLPKNPFKGVSRALGRATMARFVDRMLKSRRRSGKFLLAGWIQVIQDLFPLSDNKFLRSAGSPLEGAKSYYGANLGGAVPAIADRWDAKAIISNNVGGEGKNRAAVNEALLTHGAGPLQDAVDREGKKQMEYALKKYEQELALGVNKHWN